MIRRDPIENEIELALSPGEFIRDRACFSFVSSLEAVSKDAATSRRGDRQNVAVSFKPHGPSTHSALRS
jgi:hypothetical protein